MKWEYNDYRPEGFECWSAKWGKFYELSVAKIGENSYTIWWYYKGMTDIKEHIKAENWDEAKNRAIAIVKNIFTQKADYWRKMVNGFTNWTMED